MLTLCVGLRDKAANPTYEISLASLNRIARQDFLKKKPVKTGFLKFILMIEL